MAWPGFGIVFKRRGSWDGKKIKVVILKNRGLKTFLAVELFFQMKLMESQTRYKGSSSLSCLIEPSKHLWRTYVLLSSCLRTAAGNTRELQPRPVTSCCWRAGEARTCSHLANWWGQGDLCRPNTCLTPTLGCCSEPRIVC